MSARSHVDVNERRLRPIYDSLDYGNNKKAIQEADKVLKKQKDFPCARALKALALLRLSRHTESAHLLQEVHDQSPTDEATLQAMAICYREMHRLDLIADMYANAHKAKPDSEDILTALFMAHVRMGDYKKQQQTAMTLHRLRPTKNPYYFWAVMSIVMQAHSDNKLGRSMFLPLAERMTQKYVTDNKIEAEAEVRMYLIILEQLENYEEALNVINGPLGEKLSSELNYKKVKNAELLIKLRRWPEASAAYRKMLLDEPDHWKFYEEYLRMFFTLADANWEPSEENSGDQVDHTLEQVVTFLSEQETLAQQAERPVRGPHLARLRLLQHLVTRNAPDEHIQLVGDPVDLFVQYYKKFGSKFCCFSDVKDLVTVLGENERKKFLDAILGLHNTECESEEEVSVSEKRKTLQRHITIVQMCQHLGIYKNLDRESRSRLVCDLISRYQKGLEYGDDLVATELQYSDVYLQVVSSMLYEDWQLTGDDTILWQAIVLLEMGLTKSAKNYQFKLLLIQLYCRLGAFGPCTDLYESLEIKHIQNDALGYVIARHVGRLGHFSSAGMLYDAMLRFFTLNHKDTTEYLISSYKYGSFTKVQEFVAFRERLQNSVQYASATAERLLLDFSTDTSSHTKTEEIVTYMDIDPEKDRTSWADLRDNRDLSVMTNYTPLHTKNLDEEFREKSFAEEVAWLKVRNLTVRCLAAAVKLGLQVTGEDRPLTLNNINNGDQATRTMADVLRDLSEQLKSHIQLSTDIDIPEYPITGPFRTRLCTYLAQEAHRIFCDGIQCVLHIYNLHDKGLDKSEPELTELLRTSIVDRLQTLIKGHRRPLVRLAGDKAEFQVTSLENLVLITEMIGYLTIFTGVCHKLLRVIKGGLIKRGKKKKDPVTTLPAVFEDFAKLVVGLEQCIDEVQTATKEVDPACLAEDLQSLKLTESTHYVKDSADLQEQVWKKMEISYQESTKELEIFLDNKLKYLSTFGL